MTSRVLSCLLCLFVLVSLVLSQTLQLPSSLKPGEIRAYEGFLRNVALVSSKADELDLKGTKHGLRQGVCNQFGISAADCGVLFQIAVSVTKQLQALDEQANAIIQKARQTSLPSTTPPPPPASLGQLQSQRDGFVQSGVNGMASRMTAGAFSAINNHLYKAQVHAGKTK